MSRESTASNGSVRVHRIRRNDADGENIPLTQEERLLQSLVANAEREYANSMIFTNVIEDENLGDEEVRRKIKESTGFDYDEIMLGLKNEPKGLREFQRMQSPLPSFLSEKERSIYQKLFRDLAKDIQLVKEDIFDVEVKLRETIDQIDGALLLNQDVSELNRMRMSLESQHVSLILRLSQAEDAYKSLRDSLENSTRNIRSESPATMFLQDIVTNSLQETVAWEEGEAMAILTKATEFLQEKRKRIAQQKDQLFAEQEVAKKLIEKYKEEQEGWSKKRLDHRSTMVQFIEECQKRIEEINLRIERYQKTMIYLERRMLREPDNPENASKQRTAKVYQDLILDSRQQLAKENATIEEITRLLGEL